MRHLQRLRLDFMAYQIEPTGWLGDSPSRFDFYTNIARDCDHILELGVFTGLTTTAFMLAQPKSLISVDTTDQYFHIQDDLKAAAVAAGIAFEFRMLDDLTMPPVPCDLLFIDTTHTYDQTLSELNRFGQFARKKIVLHDMNVAGVYQAVFQWLWDNKNFHITYHDSMGCGAVVLERYFGADLIH